MVDSLDQFFSELECELFYQIFLLIMLDRAKTHEETHSPLQLVEQLEWIADSDRFYQQISRSLLQEMQAICSQHISAEVETQLFEAINGFVHKISIRMKTVLQNCALEIAEQTNKISECELQVNQKEDTIATLNQSIEALNGKISSWQTEYDMLKNELAQTQERYQRKLRQVKREKKEIKQTFRMVQEDTKIERALMENLQIVKEQYQEQIINQQRQKEALKAELEDIRLKFADSAKKLEASSKKLSWQEKRINHLQDIVAEKQALIIKLRQQMLDNNRLEDQGIQENKSQSIVVKSFVDDRRSNHQQHKIHVSFAEIFKLSDEILNIPEDFQVISRKSFLSAKKSQDNLEVNKSVSHISEADRDIPISFTQVPIVEKQSKPQSVQMPDFYLAHFLLTSQAMKIKMNSEIYLEIDLTQHYSQVVRERVPFHMWDEWIRQKLKLLAGV